MQSNVPIHVTAIQCDQTKPLYSPDYLLILPLSSGISISGKEEYTLKSGEMLFSAPFSDHKIVLQAGSKALYAVIAASFLEPLMGPPKMSTTIIEPDGSNTAKEKLIELFDLQYNVRSVSNLSQMKVSMELLCALEPVISNDTALSTTPPTKSDRVSHIVAYLEAHFREPVQLGDLANTFSVSRQYISTILHKELGITFSEYLTNLRLNEAVRLLLTTDKTITEIVTSSGFPNLKAFNQIFRKRYGIQPKEYRQKKLVHKPAEPEKNVLNDVNQLLKPYRLVYQKAEEAARITDTVGHRSIVPLARSWNILNVDNCYECLQTDVQASLKEIQEKLQFQYVRLINLICHEITPYMPTKQRHRFTNFIRLIDFMKKINLTPMILLGNYYQLMPDAVMVSNEGYSASLPEWLFLLEELLQISVARWGAEWVDTWRFEFHMPQTIYGQENFYQFIDLFTDSTTLIRRHLPNAEIGGPALSLNKEHLPRWEAWFHLLQEYGLRPDFISMELWADYTYNIESFRGQHGEHREMHTIHQIHNADTSLTQHNVHLLKSKMAQYGYGDTKLYISAFGITKYRATSAQVGGHCSAYLTKCILELNDIVDGIGCWKALNNEAEYQDEYVTFSTGCGLLSRHELKNLNYYGFSFLTGLLPYKLSQGLHSIVTTDRHGNYAVLLHNCKNYSDYFCRHYVDEKGLQFRDPRLYKSNVALEQTIVIQDVTPQEYMVKQFLIGDQHGCIASVLLQMGRVRILDDTEIEYVGGQSLPYQHGFTISCEKDLQFSVTLQPNEVMLLKISPENGICYF